MYAGKQEEETLEEFWRNRHDIIKERGYLLCPQNCSGCTKISAVCKQSQYPAYTVDLPEPHTVNRNIAVPHTIHATHITDGRLVVIKVMQHSISEGLRRLQSRRLDIQPNNRCTRVLDMFEDIKPTNRNAEKRWIVVLPFLCPVPSASLKTVGDVAEFVNQALMGIAFMHRYNVAHRDCSMHSILTDTGTEHIHQIHREEMERAFLSGITQHETAFLPFLSNETDDSGRPQRRSQLYFTGIDYWVWIAPSQAEAYGALAQGNCSRDLSPPEYDPPWAQEFRRVCSGMENDEFQEFYNPFTLDIYLVGMMLKKDFLERYSNVEFLRALVEIATHEDREMRPSAAEYLKEWSVALASISPFARWCGLHPRDNSWVKRLGMSISRLSKLRVFKWLWRNASSQAV
ncbi:hypothetical protein BDY19DRAFT_994034 [Irpex rosettiformis]|uniref:Uncharacterized protein n=1 Tax=Irpex rosettiformis TaxID=378272 RepID=A0ACB8U391_9APHY|nr:hypothetical protein BDY19DRAFT_994034 [Irpex rosettiformis]